LVVSIIPKNILLNRQELQMPEANIIDNIVENIMDTIAVKREEAE
jgi:hypothetical protein